VARGCLHGNILSPLMWSLVVDELIGALNGNGYYTLGYADDMLSLSAENFQTLSQSFCRRLLSMVQQWCDMTQLSINPQKTVIVPFNRKERSKGPKRNQPSLDTLCS
jgi:hypothetical protein